MMDRATGLLQCMAVVLGVTFVGATNLSEDYYLQQCPEVANLIAEVVASHVQIDPTLAPSLLRMHFHDCFVGGCDGSVLLNSTGGNPVEKDAFPNVGSLRGFNVIDDAKAAVEAVCPVSVSCADILALAARDAIQQIGGISWSVPLGRRDGVVSSFDEANNNLPPPTADFSLLKQMFANKGLSVQDLVALSGAHTIGFSHCSSFQSRLYNFSSDFSTDPTLDPRFTAQLKRQCAFGDGVTKIRLDSQPKFLDVFDSHYYSNNLRGKVLFESDQALLTNPTSSKLVKRMNRYGPGAPFLPAFAVSMTKLGSIGVLTGAQGQIRKNCAFVNPSA